MERPDRLRRDLDEECSGSKRRTKIFEPSARPRARVDCRRPLFFKHELKLCLSWVLRAKKPFYLFSSFLAGY